jgi:glycosyltransferase involved in cell wall biosynthesis
MTKKITKLPEISIFFPAYNEAGNIEVAIKQALKVATQIAHKFEVIVVNDGSQDNTYKIAKKLSQKYASVRVVTQKNQGYGGALKRGFKTAKYEWIFFTDSDLQFDMSELKKFIQYTKDNDLVIGYRKNRAEGFKRALLAKALKIWNRVLLGFPSEIKDIDCAFKLIHKSVIQQTQPLMSDGAMISTELLLKAIHENYAYRQIGVRHYRRLHGSPTGSNRKVILKAVFDTFRLQYMLIKQKLQTFPSFKIDFFLKPFYTN